MQSKAFLKSNERTHRGVRVNSTCATTSRSTDTAPSMDLPSTEQYWLEDICSSKIGVRRLAIILASSLYSASISVIARYPAGVMPPLSLVN
jgi:hypothetical protein